MKFVCDRCQTKYSIADEKVRGKILKVRCKSCSNIITVREPGAGSGPVRRPSAANPALAAPAVRPAGPPLATAAASQAERPPAPPAPAHRPPPPPPPADDGVQWYIALDGNRTGPFTRKQVIDKVAALPKEADLHVWNEQLGSWKPPAEVPAIAHELAVKRHPPGPPPFPGAPRRPTQPPMLPVGSAAPARPSGAHVVASAIGPGVGLKLPPPSGPPPGRRITGPATSLAAAGLAQAEAHHESDPSSLLETPGPEPHMLDGLAARNGAGRVAASNGSAVDRSDVLNTLNLAGASRAAPRLLSSEAVVGWQPASGDAPAARQRSARAVLGFLAVIGVICAVFVLNTLKKPKPAPLPEPKITILEPTDPLAGAADKANAQPPSKDEPPSKDSKDSKDEPLAPPPAVAPVVEPVGHGKRGRGAHGRGAPAATTLASNSGPSSASPVTDANARYRDNSRPGLAITGGGVSRPAPTQADISRVINNNRAGIKTCYQRALLRDNSLTHGKITVQLTIGISGHVKRASIDGPPQFRALDPCIKELVGHWAFPQASDEYGTEFAYLFQGNE